MNECTLILIMIIPIISLVFFFSGVFESWIVKNCTQCGKEGSTTAISHIYEAIATGKPVSIFGYRNSEKPWGVLHNIHLCRNCFEDFFWVDIKSPWTMGCGRRKPN